MNDLRQITTRANLWAWGLRSAAKLMLAFLLSLAQVQYGFADIDNSAIATGTFGITPITSNTAAEAVPVVPATPVMDVIKSGVYNDSDGTPGVSAGDTITYIVTAQNTGNVTLTGVTASDPLVFLNFDPGSDVNSNGDLDVGETWRWVGLYIITAADIATGGGGDGDIDNTATISSDQLPDQTASTEVPLSFTPVLQLTKSATYNDVDGTPGQSAGDTISYIVTLTNIGSADLTTIVVSDPMVTLSFAGVDFGSDGILSPNEVWNYTGTYVITAADISTNGGGDGQIENTVTVSSGELPDQTASASIAVDQVPALDLTKTADLTGVSGAGDPVTYTVTATNTGNVPLTNVMVSDPILTPNSVTCPTVAVGAICQLIGTYITTAADFTTGSITNTATATSDEGAGDNETLVTNLAPAPAIEVTKTATPTSAATVGTVINYDVEVENTGNITLTGINVTDPMLALDCGSGTSTIASLAAGVSVTCSGSYSVTQADFDAGTDLVNTATATDDGTHGVTDDGSATVTLPTAPSLVVSKTGNYSDSDSISGVSAGDAITYQVTIQNTGNTALTNVNPVDPLAALVLISGDSDGDFELDVSETWIFEGTYLLTQSDIDSNGGGDGEIENTVTVTTDQTGPQDASSTVPLNINPSMSVAKSGTLNDDDGTPGLSAGDTVDYTVTVTNTGNIRLTNIGVSDPLVALTLASGDSNSDGRLDVPEIWVYQGTTIITQADLDTLGGGDGDIDNTVTVSSDQLPDETASHELPIAPVTSFELKKVATTPVQLFPTIFQFDYQLTLRNTGAITQTGIQLEDDVASSIAPGTLVGAPVVSISGFSGTGGVNGSYDGQTDIELLTGDVQLTPGGIALVTITLTIDTGSNSIDGLNTARVNSDQITTLVPSDDPRETPDDATDINPTPIRIIDTDGDGSTDVDEGTSDDRDQDGDTNEDDYDPTGYFYCQADGRILPGGLISVENLTTGGIQTGLGASSDIVVVRDGSDGSYQFHVTQPGEYRLSYTLPANGIASTDRNSLGTLDATTLLPNNPAIIGSGQFGSSGFLADYTASANPYYTVFQFEAGDPVLFNNNIPLQFCGVPEVTSLKEVASTDNFSFVEFRLTAVSSGNEQVNDVQITDDLAATFGAGGFDAAGIVATIEAAPAGFAGSINPFYNGSTNISLLTSGGNLQPDEQISILLRVPISVAAGVYENTMSSSGVSPLDGSAVAPSTDTVELEVVDGIEDGPLVVQKTATPGSVPIGGLVAYKIVVSNPGEVNVINATIVDIIPNGMTYIKGSASLDGTKREPAIAVGSSGRELTWSDITVVANDKVTINLTLAINASAANDEFVNLALVRNGSTGDRISNIARAKVLLEIEPVFQCSDLIGRVFDDKDRDGYYDEGEPGLPGVRLATAKGLLITTDKFGRYHIACGAIPDEDIGSNFILKLDPRTLPTGYRVTSENPRVVRLTRGKLTKLNFAAANLIVVRLELNDNSFQRGSNRLKRSSLRTIGELLPILEREPSVLRVIYRRNDEPKERISSRLDGLKTLITRAWEAKSRVQELKIETSILE